MSSGPGPAPDTRTRLVEAAARLLREEGPAGVTTRRVADAAGVQVPALYRLFGDKDGLLDVVAEHVMASYVAEKVAHDAATEVHDPVEHLREGWRRQIEFALANPAVFRMLSDPARATRSEAAESGRRVLEARVHRIAAAGLLRVPEARAVDLVQAAGIGAITVLLATEHHDPDLAEAALAGVLDQVLTGSSTDGPATGTEPAVAAAITLRAHADGLDALSPGERTLLVEWLDRVTTGGPH